MSAERDTLQERSREQLVKISGLEARLDEVRRADHPAAADLRHRLALLQEDLEEKREELTKKGREVREREDCGSGGSCGCSNCIMICGDKTFECSIYDNEDGYW